MSGDGDLLNNLRIKNTLSGIGSIAGHEEQLRHLLVYGAYLPRELSRISAIGGRLRMQEVAAWPY